MKILLLLFTICILALSINFKHTYSFEKSSLKPITLDYSLKDLNDFIDADTLKYIYSKEYISYLNNLDYLLKDFEDFKNAPLEELLKNLDSIPDEVALKVKLNAASAFNLEKFFKILSPKKTTLKGDLLEELNREFSSLDNFKNEFKHLSLNSKDANWIFLISTPNGKLKLTTSKEMSSPIVFKYNTIICLNMDKRLYKNKEKYIDDFFDFINWNQASKNYLQINR